MFPWKLINFYIGWCNIPSIYLRFGVFWHYLFCKLIVLLRDNYSIIISPTSYMWGLVFYSYMENIWRRHGCTTKGQAHKAGLANQRVCWRYIYRILTILCFVSVLRVWYFLLFILWINLLVGRTNTCYSNTHMFMYISYMISILSVTKSFAK